MKVYADSSFVVAIYLPQQHSHEATAFMESHHQPLPFTPWLRLEVRNAIRLAVFHGAIEAAQSRAQLRQLDADLREETLLQHTPLDWVSVLRRAELIGAAHNETMGCRSSDLFHVAAALESGAEQFLTFDARQKKMARAAGLTV